MLKKSFRAPVGSIPRSGKVSFSGRYITVKITKNSLPHSRVGVVVGKKSIDGATQRNKTKRVVFEEFMKNKELLRAPGKDYLVIINKSSNLDGDGLGELTKELGGFISETHKTI